MVVPEDIRNKARQSLERMLAISGGKRPEPWNIGPRLIRSS